MDSGSFSAARLFVHRHPFFLCFFLPSSPLPFLGFFFQTKSSVPLFCLLLSIRFTLLGIPPPNSRFFPFPPFFQLSIRRPYFLLCFFSLSPKISPLSLVSFFFCSPQSSSVRRPPFAVTSPSIFLLPSTLSVSSPLGSPSAARFFYFLSLGSQTKFPSAFSLSFFQPLFHLPF